MAKPSGISVRVETWTVSRNRDHAAQVTKVAVRHPDGKFHGATNYPLRTDKTRR